MDWMQYAQPDLLVNLISKCIKKKLFRLIFVYGALFSLIVYAEVKIGFLVNRPCDTGAFVTVYPTNNTTSAVEDRSSVYYLPRLQDKNSSQLLSSSKQSSSSSSLSSSSSFLLTPSASEGNSTRFKVLLPGEYIHVRNPDVYIPTAMRLLDFPNENDFTLILHAWTQNFSRAKLSCCLLKTLDDDFNEIISVQAIPYKENSYIKPDLGVYPESWSSEFHCSIPKNSEHFSNFKYVTFSSKNSCSSDDIISRDVLKIESNERVFRSVGLCMSLPRTFVNAEYFVEWMEWYRLQGATEIYAYYDHDLHKAIDRVLQYYTLIGFVKLFRLRHPASDGKDTLPTINEDMVSNDCRHRMSHFDYVITLDVSELIAPKSSYSDIYDILQSASKLYPNAGVFQIHSYQIILDWRPSRKSPLHLARHELRTNVINMGDDEIQARWAYMPRRTHITSKHRAWPKKTFTSKAVPRSSYSLLRFVRCHPRILKDCIDSESKVKDDAISRFQNALIMGMREIPIEFVLKYNQKYVQQFQDVRIPGDSYYIGPRRH